MTFKGWWCDWLVVVVCGKWGLIQANILWNYFENDFDYWVLCACVFALDDCCDVNWLNLGCWPSELAHDFGRRPSKIFEPTMTIHSIWSWTPFHECSPFCIDFSRIWPSPLQGYCWYVHGVNIIEAFVHCEPHEPKSHPALVWPVYHPLWAISLSFDKPMSTWPMA